MEAVGYESLMQLKKGASVETEAVEQAKVQDIETDRADENGGYEFAHRRQFQDIVAAEVKREVQAAKKDIICARARAELHL